MGWSSVFTDFSCSNCPLKRGFQWTVKKTLWCLWRCIHSCNHFWLNCVENLHLPAVYLFACVTCFQTGRLDRLVWHEQLNICTRLRAYAIWMINLCCTLPWNSQGILHGCPYTHNFVQQIPQSMHYGCAHIHTFFIQVWKWSHLWHTACKKTILPLEKVWVTPHPWRTACKLSSLMIWVCSHPGHVAHKVPSLKYGCTHTQDMWHITFPLWSMSVLTPKTCGT